MKPLVIPVRDGFELKLREEEDAKSFFVVTNKNRDYLRRWLPWVDCNKTMKDTEKFIQSCQLQFRKKEAFDLGIWFEGEWVGSIALHEWDKVARKAAIGYWISEELQGKGIVTEAVCALIEYGFQKLNLNRIEIRCATCNIKSQAIPERLHFKKEGICRESEWLYDHFVDLIVYSLLASEWNLKKNFLYES